MTLKTPLQVIKSRTSAGVPSIIDSDGHVVVSFGNFRRRSLDWCWKAARQITHSVNGSVYTQLVTENRELRAEIKRLKAEVAQHKEPEPITYQQKPAEEWVEWSRDSAANSEAYGITSDPIRLRTITVWMSDEEYEAYERG